MSERPLRLAWLAALFLMLISTYSSAQTVNCAGVPQWNAATIYNPGDRLVYQGSLYQALIQIWNAPPTHCPSCNWYQVLGTCGGGSNNAPSAQITSPANGATFTAPANISIAATASDSDGTVVKVDFFQGTTLLESDTTSPYSFSWTNVPAGTYSLRAVATDNLGATGSSTVSITVRATTGQPPVVSITSPTIGANFTCGASVQVTASASDPDGFVSRVEFLDNGVRISSDTTAPYSATWVASPAGSHGLTARAIDDAGGSTTSSAVNVTVGSCGNNSSLPARVLVGYWHNFDNGSGFIKLRDVSTDWDVVNLAFGEPVAGSTSNIAFTPDVRTSVAEIQSDVQILHGRGKKVLLSVGGANGHVELRNATERQQFVDSITSIIRQYGLDGLFEGQSVHVNPGDADITNPTTPVIVNLIAALRQIRQNIGPSFILTMAPETFFVQVGYQFYGGTSNGDSRTGAYLPVIHGVRDILTLIHVQHYNTGSVTALDNQFYNSGNADFHVAMAEMLLTGFPVANTGRTFQGLRPDQVAIGLPANINAAGSGFTQPAEVHRALNYLIRGQSFGGRYVLRNPAGYRAFRGLMAWSVNWDRFANFDFSRNHRAYLNSLPPP
jgi:chitinase